MVSICGSPPESRPLRDRIGNCSEERLMVRFAAAQCVEADAAFLQIDFGANESVRPIRGDIEPVPQHLHLAMIVRSAQIDDRSRCDLLQVLLPITGKWSSWRSGCNSLRTPTAQGADKLAGLCEQRAARTPEMEPSPDLRLPAPIQIPNRRLESRFSGRHEHRNDTKAQADATHPANHVRPVVRPLKHVVVVELRVDGQAKFP